MARDVVLHAEPRAGAGRAELRRLRESGRLPAVIYGTGIEPRSLAVDRHDFIRTLTAHGAHALVTLKVGDEEYLALVKDVQVDAVRQLALHVDFHRVEANTPVHTEVELHLVGEPVGAKVGGGVLEPLLRMVAIEALPRNIPELLEFDVSQLGVGAVARVADIVVPAGVTILTDPDETVATVSAPRVEVAAAPTAEAAAEAAAAPEAAAEAEES